MKTYELNVLYVDAPHTVEPYRTLAAAASLSPYITPGRVAAQIEWVVSRSAARGAFLPLFPN